MTFEVLNADGSLIDYESICKEEWASHLLKYDIDGFWIGEDGQLMLMDDCGKIAFPPSERFKVIFNGDM